MLPLLVEVEEAEEEEVLLLPLLVEVEEEEEVMLLWFT